MSNPNVTGVTDVTVAEQGVNNGGVCALDGSGVLGTLAPGQSASAAYTCTYAAAPSPAAGINTALVTWTLPDSGDPPAAYSADVVQSFTFGAPTKIVHNTVNVSDLFDGGTPATIDGGANLSSSASLTYSRTVAVPATACRVYDNTATVTSTDAPPLVKSATATVEACRQAPPVVPPPPPPAPPVVPASVPSKTTITLDKRASSPTVKAGGTVDFAITWKNTGKIAARDVLICDRLPNQMSFVTAKGATFKNGKACWSRKSVAKGATLTFRVTARVEATVGNEKLVNVATATASNAKPATAEAPVRARRKAATKPGGVTG